LSWQTLAGTALGHYHNCVNQVIESSKLQFFGSHLSEKSPCIAVEQVNILDVAAIHRQLLVMIFLRDSFSSYYIASFVIWAIHQHRNEIDSAVLLKYNSRNIHRIKFSGIFL